MSYITLWDFNQVIVSCSLVFYMYVFVREFVCCFNIKLVMYIIQVINSFLRVKIQIVPLLRELFEFELSFLNFILTLTCEKT